MNRVKEINFVHTEILAVMLIMSLYIFYVEDCKKEKLINFMNCCNKCVQTAAQCLKPQTGTNFTF